MLLDQASEWLGWPSPEQVLEPKGEGSRACVRLARQKIGESLKILNKAVQIRTGILTPDPNGASTAAPIAIVCEFSNAVSDDVLSEAHRLSWNFSQSSVLVTLEPHRIIAWSCLKDPTQSLGEQRVCEYVSSAAERDLLHQASVRELLHWVSLVTGHLQRSMPTHFPSEGRADLLLLKNLRHVRKELISQGLERSYCHDLLARVIFTQFLFHRKDSNGNPFFSKTLLTKKCDGTLKHVYADFSSILRNKDDTYSLFRWLDARFNGDLFPGAGDENEVEKEFAWQTECNAVTSENLELLADLVSGQIDTNDRQLLLWPQYSFDTIPLEFISSVYEEFLNEDRDANKAYYTKPQLVDYVLDAVLPWGGVEWDLTILDPACGSGIFLVKAFQRIIHRWRQSHSREPLVSDLKPLLAKQFRGVDINPDAVRVACFSLYLSMVDAIDPKHYVTREKVFPRLRGTQIIQSDFFDSDLEMRLTDWGTSKFDLVIGNAPWGDNSISLTSEASTSNTSTKSKRSEITKAEKWAQDNGWPITNHDIGPLFVAKGLDFLKSGGRLALLQPAPPWLYQRGNPAIQLRQKLFTNHYVDEITNLSALRKDIFEDVIGPSCLIVANNNKPTPQSELAYFTPKPVRSIDGLVRLQIEPQDVNRISHYEAATNSQIWTILSYGGRRDLQLIQKLARLPTLGKLKEQGKVQVRLGVIPGDKLKPLPALAGVPYFEDTHFPKEVFLELDARKVNRWHDPRVNGKDSTNFSAFGNPQMLIKQSIASNLGRFRAVVVKSDDPTWGVVCKQTYLSVRDNDKSGSNLASACITYNSFLAVYFLFLTSSRLGHYITEVKSNELLEVPLPDLSISFDKVKSFDQIDEIVRESLELSEADKIIVDDILQVSLPDALWKSKGRGRLPTSRGSSRDLNDPEMSAYAATFMRVMQQTFSSNVHVSFTIYQEPNGASMLPVRVLIAHIGEERKHPVSIQQISVSGLFNELAKFHRDVLSKKARSTSGDGIGFQRVSFFFHQSRFNTKSQNLTIIKPDEYRYWTRSQAMRDADQLCSTILRAAKGKS